MLKKFKNADIGIILGLAGFGLVAAIGLAIAFWVLSKIHAPKNTASIQCQIQQENTKTVVGTLRRAGSSFFIQDKYWHFIAPACSGKPSSNCVMTEHAKMLDRTVGQTISAGFCAHEVIFYTVQGVTYAR